MRPEVQPRYETRGYTIFASVLAIAFFQPVVARASTVWTNQNAEFKNSVIWLDDTVLALAAGLQELKHSRHTGWMDKSFGIQARCWERMWKLTSILYQFCVQACEGPCWVWPWDLGGHSLHWRRYMGQRPRPPTCKHYTWTTPSS